ncbi:AAA family ATPase [Saccharopolyspora sp. SCSIO 74807]|uniref:nSTAND1 domain-containing NTPase n=1 Tax=Saccharopolyspora sp. SCSIO 74807 TaxID=3118084 RepID=UPI0030D00458
MTDRRTGSSASGAGSRALFAERFALLYVTAGDPPLKRVAEAVERTRKLDERGRPIRAMAQRISDWRRGRNVPARFAALSVVLEILIGEARKQRAQPPVAGLYDVQAWRRLWEEALATPTSSEPSADQPPADEAPSSAEPPAEDSGLCPYRGLAAFQEADSAWFFGRERSTGTLVDRLGMAAEEGGITMLVGASGAGKSSLLRAGLIPAIAAGALPEQGSASWPVRTVTPGDDPLKVLISLVPELGALLGEVEQVPAGADEEFRFAEAVRDAVSGHLRAQQGDEARLVLVVDQFEETFTMCPDDATRALFVQALHAMCTTGNAPGLVVLGLRADFYGRCLDFPELAEALQNRQMVLSAMTLAELRKAITGPAKATGLQIESGLVDVLLRDLGAGIGRSYGKPGQRAYDAGALPLLSHALLVTWQRRQSGRLTIAGYRAAGGIQTAVAGSAERAWAELDESGQTAARQVLLRLVHVGDDTQDTRRRATRQEIIDRAEHREAARRALDVLASARLVTLESEAVEISHEALLYAWPRLRGWIDQDRAGNLARQRLERDAEAWYAENQDPSLLYRGARLKTARSWAQQEPGAELSTAGREFLEASLRHRRRAGWSRRTGVAAVCLFAVIAAVAGMLAVQQRYDARFRQVLAQADQVQATDPSAAARLNLLAKRMRPDDPDVHTRLLSTQSTPLATPMTGHHGAVYLTTFSPDGKTLVTAGYDRTVRLWDVSDRGAPKPLGPPLTGFGSWATSAVFSPDGRTLAAAADDGLVRLYDVADPAHPRPLGPPITGGDGTVYLLTFSPDGRTLATANENSTARLWNVSDPARPAELGEPLRGHTARVRTLDFSPDGRTLATGGDDSTVRLWNVADPARASPVGPVLRGHAGGLHSVAFSPDGSKLASGSVDKTIRLWDTRDPAGAGSLGPVLTGHAAPVWSVKFSPDGNKLASSSEDSTARLWNISDPRNPAQLGQNLAAGSSTVYAVGFSPDGRTLATGSDDGVVRLWSLPERVLSGHAAAVNSAEFSPDGRTMVNAAEDRTLQVWDTTDPLHPRQLRPPLQVHDGQPSSVYLDFSPDGRTLATGGGDGQVRLWDFSDPARPKPLGAPLAVDTRYVGDVAFSPDGTVLAAGDTDTTVQLWDVRDPLHPKRLGTPLSGHTGFLNLIAYSPDGRTLATAGDDGTLRLWDVHDPARAHLLGPPLTAHGSAVKAVAFSPDGKTMVSAGSDKVARLWDITDPAAPKPVGGPLAGHSQSVISVAFSPDGRTLATGSVDRSVRLWDVSDRDEPRAIGQSLSEHGAAVNAVGFSPDGNVLVSTSEDNTVRLWDLDVEHAIRRICESTSGVLPKPQWERTIPQVAYRDVCSS